MKAHTSAPQKRKRKLDVDILNNMLNLQYCSNYATVIFFSNCKYKLYKHLTLHVNNFELVIVVFQAVGGHIHGFDN